ncbi:MAG: type II toxin-antitoxin system RelE/ParE family toxin [Lewinellaceae bacterium]|nr:type II toxin-antitoxin system RelE/ParE family toxin [Saprospiraceae bacterium]MCB9341149.1 type II toxin-antitoxin system RelE/ParE family toxin [Lewinellaceae bacterium]
MTLQFHSRARLDIIQAVTWYENQRKDLGKRFNKDLVAVLKKISKSPFQFPIVFEEFRKARLGKTFPFSIIYIVVDGTVYIIAIVHDKREPDFWKERI